MRPTMSAPEAIQYIQTHRRHPPEGLGARLEPDFGSPDDGGGNGGSVDEQAIRERAEHIIALGNEPDPATGIPLRYYDPATVSGEQNLRAFVNDIRGRMGLMVDAAEQIKALSGK